MPPLVEIQQRLRDAVLGGSADAVATFLVGGSTPARRLALHSRHFQASLVGVLLGKFPACVWLLGTQFMAQVAREFVRSYPPTSPCIAEYGSAFPEYLGEQSQVQTIPYASCLARLEWHLGHIAIAVDAPPIGMTALAAIDPLQLSNAVLRLQPGTRFVEASWPVDELIKLYLSDDQPEHFHIEPAAICIELTGARGTFHINRVDRSIFAFRSAIAAGSSIGAAAEHALDVDPNLDIGGALAALIADNLAVAVALPVAGDTP